MVVARRFALSALDERVIRLIKLAAAIGAMRELKIGPTHQLSTDVGPVIGAAARARLERHAERMRREARLLYACELDPALAARGHFFPPHLFELKRLDQLQTEEFGPILHVARYRSDQLPQVLAAIRSTGYGLTLGIHTRVESLAEHVFRSLPVATPT